MRVFSSSEHQRILALPKALVHLTNKSASKLATNSRSRRRRRRQEAVRRAPAMDVTYLFTQRCPYTAGMLVEGDKDRLVVSLCLVMSSVVTPTSLKSPVTRRMDAL
jgi:hypothetical protein